MSAKDASLSNSLKRKQEQTPESSHKRRRVKQQDARVIATQTSGKAFTNGEVDVEKFVKAREFEIKAIEDALKRARKGLASRAFQDVPKELRRRTASHNVMRVPKRLRARAAKEMAEDSTPTVSSRTRKASPRMRLRMNTVNRLKELAKGRPSKGKAKAVVDEDDTAMLRQVKARQVHVKKNVLQKPPRPKAKFRKRQIHKTWLPTHLFHAKRAHITPPKQPLWRMAIPLSPTVKSHRMTHRASSTRGSIAWDMSYISTIGLEGNEKSIIALFRALGVGADQAECFWERSRRWLSGTRSWNGWLCERSRWPLGCIAPATIIWCAESPTAEANDNAMSGLRTCPRLRRKAFIRVHPSAFRQLWDEVLKVSKIQQPAVTAEDLRFEIGSIELIGPASTEALIGTLHRSTIEEGKKEADVTSTVLEALGVVTNPASLPANVLIPLNIADPRLHQPHTKVQQYLGPETQHGLSQTLCTWPLDAAPVKADLFDRTGRLAACRQLPSQKSIDRRKTLAGPGKHPEPKSTDPRIPVILLAKRSAFKSQGTWTILLPWKCVESVWYSIMRFPLSFGGNPRFGGLDETRQISLEAGQPWFPGDYPGTAAGMGWELDECEKRKAEYEKRPKGKRIVWDSLNLGNGRRGEIGLGWACDWNRLLQDSNAECAGEAASTSVPHHLPSSKAREILLNPKSYGTQHDLKGAVMTVNLTLLTRGVPAACARIYRLPSNNAILREQWQSLIPKGRDRKKRTLNQAARPVPNAPAHVQRKHLAESLLHESHATRDEDEHPDTPDTEDLIGFVTSAGFNLSEGRGSATGCLLVRNLLSAHEASQPKSNADSRRAEGVCIVRNAGQAQGRLALWQLAQTSA